MAVKELRHCTVSIRDGLSGTAKVNGNYDGTMTPVSTININMVALNTTVTTQVPVGARFNIAGVMDGSNLKIFTVTARTPGTGTTTSITFTPSFNVMVSNNTDITFLPNQVDIKIGDGNVTYTRKKNYTYVKDRGLLDTVREDDEEPMDVTVAAMFEYIRTGTGEVVTPSDAFTRTGGASEWVSSSADLCEPYAVDLVIVDDRPCGAAQKETLVFLDFRVDSEDVDFKAGTLNFKGRCNATAPVVTRG
jgi:hypothetical protein